MFRYFFTIFILSCNLIFGQNYTPVIMSNKVLMDYDSNYYPIVVIGEQTWMAQNLKVIHFNDGEPIPLHTASDTTFWPGLKTPAYSWMYDNKAYYDSLKYGCLYNWYCVNTNKLCPVGWRVPSHADWGIFLTTLGSNSGIQIKNPFGWFTDNGINTSGFNAVPSGDRWSGYQNGGKITEWWSSTYLPPHFAYTFAVEYFYTYAFRSNFTVESGWPVRCLKNN